MKNTDFHVLNDGNHHPIIGFGTYKVGFIPASASSAAGGGGGVIHNQNVVEIIGQAIAAGFRMFDCARYYGNEDLVGHALAESGIPREQLYLVSKVWNTAIYEGRASVRAEVLKSLKDLKTEYIDLYLVHWPVPEGKHVEAYKELLLLKEEGLIKSVGVSNYTVEDCKELVENGLPFPAVNQIEVNPFLYRKDTIDYFQANKVVIQAYRALGNGKHMEHPTVVRVAARYGKTSAQVLGRWTLQHNCVIFPKSVVKERIFSNLDVFDFELDDEDMHELDKLHTIDEENALTKFADLYRLCVVRDTPNDGNLGLARPEFTVR